MNIHQAKQQPLRAVLAALGHEPSKEVRGELWYRSPFRHEAEPSFKINTARNIWYDFGLGSGGNIIDLALQLFQVSSIGDALRELESHLGGQLTALPLAPKIPPAPKPEANDALTLLKVQPLQNAALTGYLKTRGIDAAIARPYVQEIYYTRHQKHYFSLAFANRSGGYELRNPYFKGSTGHKDISIIAPACMNLDASILVFEGFMDFLTFLAWQNQSAPSAPVLVLNSVAMRSQALTAMREMSLPTVQLFLDNDASGRELKTQFQSELEGVNIIDQSSIYAGYKDFNEWLQGQKQAEKLRTSSAR